MSDIVRYSSAGGVVVHDGRVLVLRRRARGEIRLPKGHIEPDESPEAAAIREVGEESGYTDLIILSDLGTQTVEFDYDGRHFIRRERYYLMRPNDLSPSSTGEAQFEPVWMTWDEALAALTFEAEREWVRRAKSVSRFGLADGKTIGEAAREVP